MPRSFAGRQPRQPITNDQIPKSKNCACPNFVENANSTSIIDQENKIEMTWFARDFGLRIEDIAVQFAPDADAQFFPLGERATMGG